MVLQPVGAGRIADFGRNALHTAASHSMYGPPIKSMQYGTAAKMPCTAAVHSQPFECLGNRLGLTRQVDDERLAADHRNLARQDRGGDEVQADLAHLLAETRHHLVGHGQCRLGRHVAQRRAGAAGRQNQVTAHPVDQLAQRCADAVLLVGISRVSHAIGLRTARCSQSFNAGMPLSS